MQQVRFRSFREPYRLSIGSIVRYPLLPRPNQAETKGPPETARAQLSINKPNPCPDADINAVFQRLPAFLVPADGGQDDPSLSRGRCGSVDNMSAVFPGD